MADTNLQLDPGSGGDKLAAGEATFNSEPARVQVDCAAFLSGDEGSRAVTLPSTGAGVVGLGVQRVTLASDDPAVVDLAAMEVLLTTIDGKLTACNTGAVVISSGTVTANLSATDNAVLDAIAASVAAVDIASLPAANLGQQAMAASVSFVPASNITGGTYIGDIGFDGSLPSGSNTIGIVHAKPDSSVVYYGGTACTVKRFNKVVSADDTELIPAPTGTKKVLILELDATAMSTTETEWYLQTATADTNCWGDNTNGFLFAMDADGDNLAGRRWHSEFGILLAPDTDDAINVRMSSGQAMHFSGTYIEVA